MRQRGFTIVELVVVMGIMGILLSIATLNWNAMQTKSAIESQIKMLHADLMEVRLQALYGKKARSVVISGQVYKSYSSTVTTVTPFETKQLAYPVEWNGGGALTFDTQGLTNDEGSLCVTVANSAAIDSMVVSKARINLGKRQTGEVCSSVKIDQK